LFNKLIDGFVFPILGMIPFIRVKI